MLPQRLLQVLTVELWVHAAVGLRPYVAQRSDPMLLQQSNKSLQRMGGVANGVDNGGYVSHQRVTLHMSEGGRPREDIVVVLETDNTI